MNKQNNNTHVANIINKVIALEQEQKPFKLIKTKQISLIVLCVN